MSDVRCINCQRHIGPDELVYNIRASLDPQPPNGVACSEQCQQQENESKQRAMLFYQVMGNPFGGGKNE
jgi:hypothetical protein